MGILENGLRDFRESIIRSCGPCAEASQEQQLGPDHPAVASSLNNLAYLYDSQGRYAEAEPLYVRSLSIREQRLGPDHPHVAASLNNLAVLYANQGRFTEAEPLLVKALALRQVMLGDQHPDTMGTQRSLAAVR